MAKKHYIILAVVSYLFFLLATAPAAPVLAFIQKQAPGMHIQGISGTVWNGQAQNITINNKYTLVDTSWSFVFWRLLQGEAGINLDTTYNNPVNGYIGVGLTGAIVARNLTTELDAYEFGSMINMPLGELSGNIALDLDYLTWDRSNVPTMHGNLDWSNAAITIAEEADLGDVSIILLESDTEPLSADIKNNGGHMSVNGKALVKNSGEYSVELNMLPNENASNNLEKSLAMFAKKQSNGNYLVNNSGNLKQLGLM